MTGWYLQCASDHCHGTHFAPVVDDEGEVVRLECRQCGGTETERQREAPGGA